MNIQSKHSFLTRVIRISILLFFLGILVSSAHASEGVIPMRGKFSGIGANFSGGATHLGRFEGVIDNTAVPPHAIWTAANGDTLTNTTTRFEIDFSAPIKSNVYSYTQTIVFTGGTGRFGDVTGGATVSGNINVVTFAYDGRIEGSISILQGGS